MVAAVVENLTPLSSVLVTTSYGRVTVHNVDNSIAKNWVKTNPVNTHPLISRLSKQPALQSTRPDYGWVFCLGKERVVNRIVAAGIHKRVSCGWGLGGVGTLMLTVIVKIDPHPTPPQVGIVLVDDGGYQGQADFFS